MAGDHFLCEHRLTLDEAELVETTRATEHRVAYSAIHRVARTDCHAFIFVDKTLAHVIPVAATLPDVDAFLSELAAKREQAGA